MATATESKNGNALPFTQTRPLAAPSASVVTGQEEGTKDKDGCKTVPWVDPTSGSVTRVKNCARCPSANHLAHDWIACERGVIKRGMMTRPGYRRYLGQRTWEI